MDQTKETLAQIIVAETKRYWDDEHKPLLLSDLVPILINEKYQYKDLIAPLTLKQFVSSMSGKVKVVQHSQQKAKVGVIPPDETYSFEIHAVADEREPVKDSLVRKSHARSNKYVVLNFLEALSTLDKEDLDQIVIPAGILAKLVR
ncbi:hypothetical protein [Rhizobium sp. 2MFCol3.1]|uniref:hypothetical protein n=1 Tax=Rhizobium sp. 2MFCol3.1 TaxID=1246459 RepID=UPI00036D692F|nr:hypothetical protein [Rhizobium sp. 2MFCol3.1]